MGIIAQSVTVNVDGSEPLKVIKAAIAKARGDRLVGSPGAGNVEGELLTNLCRQYLDGRVTLTDAQVSKQAQDERRRILDAAKAKAEEVLSEARAKAERIIAEAEEKATKPEANGGGGGGKGDPGAGANANANAGSGGGNGRGNPAAGKK